jgi:adenosylcobyric acid synthase
MQIILRGKPYQDIVRDQPWNRDEVMKKACESYDRLIEQYDAVICEGSGSPAELNLMSTDMANVGLMKARGVKAILVGDIERGGVFAAIYGTWLLMPDELKPLMKGFVINRFRGDASILGPGIQKVEELTGMKCFGIVPYESLKFPEEDSLSQTGGNIGSGDLHEEFIRNLDRLIDNAVESGVDLEGIVKLLEE